MNEDPRQEPQAFVRDPEDFNRQQRFKEIHDARQRVTEYLSQMELPDEGGRKYNLREATRLSYLVSIYIMELEPLIVESDIDTAKFIADKAQYDTLTEFATQLGVTAGHNNYKDETPSPQASMHYFSAANRFYARVGMDLELSEDRGDAGFDYSDILEEGPPGDGDKPDIADGVRDE